MRGSNGELIIALLDVQICKKKMLFYLFKMPNACIYSVFFKTLNV